MMEQEKNLIKFFYEVCSAQESWGDIFDIEDFVKSWVAGEIYIPRNAFNIE